MAATAGRCSISWFRECWFWSKTVPFCEHGFGTANTWTRFGTHDWADQQWGAHLVFYGVWRSAGAAGLVTLNVALLAAGLALCLRAGARRGSGPIWSALLLLLVAVICVGELVFVRTQSFSVLCFGLLLWLLGRDDGRLERRVLLGYVHLTPAQINEGFARIANALAKDR